MNPFCCIFWMDLFRSSFGGMYEDSRPHLVIRRNERGALIDPVSLMPHVRIFPYIAGGTFHFHNKRNVYRVKYGS